MPLFAFFGLWTTTLLAGGVAVSIPVIIHLLNRRRYKIVTWAAMRFLLNAQKQNTRRMRVEQLILLVCRMALVAFIVMAMAAVMPWAEPLWAWLPGGKDPQATTDKRVHHIFVVDASLSMNLRDGNSTSFDRARQQVIDKIDSAGAGDGFSVLLLKDNPTWLVGKPSQDGAKVRRELESARAGHGNASLPAALNMVVGKISEASARFPAQVVYFVTDMQRATWQGAVPSSSELEEGKRDPTEIMKDRALVVVVDVGRDDASNLAVTDLSFTEPFVTTASEVTVNASVQNFGSDLRRAIHVELLVGKAREHATEAPLAMHLVAEKVIAAIMPNDQQPVQMGYRFPRAGTYAVQVRLQHPDHLDVDDSRTVVVTVKDTIPVLLVNGKIASDKFDTATGYLRLSLNPLEAVGAERSFAPLRPRVVSQGQFADLSEDELREVECIYWSDVPQFGGADLRRLESHVRRGGGLVVSMGDKALENLDAYNRLLYKDGRGLLPAKLNKKIQAPADEYFFIHNDDEKAFHDLPLREFKGDIRTDLSHVRFYQYVQASASPHARLILKYGIETSANANAAKGETLPVGDPAMLDWNPPIVREDGNAPPARDGKRAAAAQYRGKVVLVTSTLNTDWSNWPGSPTYLAMMQELTRLAVSGRLREQSVVVGMPLEQYLAGATAEVDVTFHYPEGVTESKPVKSRTQLIEDVNVIHFGDSDETRTDFSGIYRVVVGATGQEVPFAVNVPVGTSDGRGGSESDLARLTADGLKKAYPAWENLRYGISARNVDTTGGPENVHTIVDSFPRGPEVAAVLLGLVLLLLFVEVVLAWKFGHYTSVEGVTAPTNFSIVWPLSLAIAALVVFIIAAAAFYVAVENRDVMALVPRALFREELRAWIDGLQGLPPAPAGESPHWEPQFNQWLPGFLHGSQWWWTIGLLFGGGTLIVLTYLAEAPAVARPYKLILAGLRVCMLILTVWLLLPQFSVVRTQEVWPDVVILLDTSRSMGEPDAYQDRKVAERAAQLSGLIRKQVEASLPEKLKQLQMELEVARGKKASDPSNNAYRDEVDYLEGKVRYWEKQKDVINSPKWRPTRLQLVQALFAQPDNDWLQTLLHRRQMRIHLFQLDVNGRAIKLTDQDGPLSEIADPDQPAQLTRAKNAIGRLEADGKESRLGTALQQVIDQYRGSSLAGVVMVTDGVTTRDRSIGEAASEYAAQKGVPLFLIGVGDDAELHDLKLESLVCDDVVFKGDRVNFECRLTGQGYKDVTVPVVLKQKGKDGKEKEVDRVNVKVDPNNKAVPIRLKHTPTEVGRKMYIVEVEPPKIEGNEKPMPPGNLRLERAIEVVEDKEIKVLLVEQQPRYEFRYLKFLLERESPNEKSKKKSISLNVVLLDAEDGFAEADKTALADFPATLEELNKYDVVIFGDCDPNHRKLGTQRLKNLANFVRGEDEKGKKLPKTGGGFLMIAGTAYSPHAYKGTPLIDIIPVEPLVDRPPPEPERRLEALKLELTPSGRFHPIFKFGNSEADNERIIQKFAPMYWSASQYRVRRSSNAEVLAVHPHRKVDGPAAESLTAKLPLVVQQYVGTGRSMFFGFDETWRWRKREDEAKYNTFWIQTIRYLSRGRSNRTDLHVEKQVPYHPGEPIKVTVRFPDGATGPDGMRMSDKSEVKVLVEYRAAGSEKDGDAEVQTVTLAKVQGSFADYDATMNRTREGKYRFRLLAPDVRKHQPDGEQPSADATVELPPGELDRLRMNAPEMQKAALVSQGGFYTLATADRVIDEIPPGTRVSFNTAQPPYLVWNHTMVFSLVMLLLSAEWFLRKRKHLL